MKKIITHLFSIALCFASFAAFGQQKDSLIYTGAVQKWVVPSCATSITISVYGAQGQGGLGPATRSFPTATPGGVGGLGGVATGVLAVTPGDTVYVYVGGRSGWNGGGDTGLGYGLEGGFGGGASDARYGGFTLADRVIVGGGGGGGGGGGSKSLCSPGTPGPGGDGGAGGLTSTAGSTGTETCTGSCPTQGIGGNGATVSSGGTGGAAGTGPVANGTAGGNGVLGIGGSGGGTNYNSPPYWSDATGIGGGGGGGYYGGGGGGGAGFAGGCGAPGGGGGGGSSYIGGVTSGTTNDGVNAGNGYVIINTPCTTTGFSSIVLNSTAKIFPNPNTGEFSVITTNIAQNKSKIYVYDVLNNMIYSSKLNSGSTKVSLVNKPAGVYWYKIADETGKVISTGKLIVE